MFVVWFVVVWFGVLVFFVGGFGGFFVFFGFFSGVWGVGFVVGVWGVWFVWVFFGWFFVGGGGIFCGSVGRVLWDWGGIVLWLGFVGFVEDFFECFEYGDFVVVKE